MLQAINTKDKSSIPTYLVFRDRGYVYFPHSSFIPFLQDLDTLLKSVVNDESFKKHGNELVKVKILVSLMFDCIYIYISMQ